MSPKKKYVLLVQSFLIKLLLVIPFISCEELGMHGLNWEEIYISTFPGNKSSAISFTFDDSCPSSFTKIAPIFEANEIRATFFIISGGIKSDDEWMKWRELRDKGFEIGNHTLSHMVLTDLDTTALEDEINKSFQLIREHIGSPPTTFAPPGHKTNAFVSEVVAENHLFSRASGICDWQGWVSNTTMKDVRRQVRQSIERGDWYVIAAHGIDDGWEPITEELLTYAIELCKKHSNVMAVETFENIAFYKTERENSNFHVDRQEDKIVITITSSLDETIYNHPLTLVVKRPKFPKNFQVHNLTTNTLVTSQKAEADYITIPVYLNNSYEIRWQ